MPQPRLTGTALPPPLFAAGGLGTEYLAIAALTCALFIYGFVGDVLGPVGEVMRQVAIFLTVALAMAGAALCIVRGMLLAAILSIAGLLSVFVYLAVFSENSLVPFSWMSGGSYVGVTLIGLFSLTLQDRTFGRLMKHFYFVCCAYTVFYVLASVAIKLGAVDIAGTHAIAGADDFGRGPRLHPAIAALIFGTTYAVIRWARRPNVWDLLLIALFLAAWIATQSRLITALAALVIAGYMLAPHIRMISRAALYVFLAIFAYSLALAFYPEINPFTYFSDTSAVVRINSIHIVANSMRYYWLHGAGIAFGVDGYLPLSGITYFFPGDIGILGILYIYGIPGAFAYLAICYLACTADPRMASRGYSPILTHAVTVTGVILTFYSFQSAQFNGGASGAIFASLFVALAVTPRASERNAGLPVIGRVDISSQPNRPTPRRF